MNVERFVIVTTSFQQLGDWGTAETCYCRTSRSRNSTNWRTSSWDDVPSAAEPSPIALPAYADADAAAAAMALEWDVEPAIVETGLALHAIPQPVDAESAAHHRGFQYCPAHVLTNGRCFRFGDICGACHERAGLIRGVKPSRPSGRSDCRCVPHCALHARPPRLYSR